MDNNKILAIRIRSISEIKFSMTSGLIGSEDRGNELQLGFKNHIEPDFKKNLVQFDFGVMYSLGNETILECIYAFEFEIPNLELFLGINAEGKLIDNGVIPHLISAAIGTMRGILVVKTAGTDLSKYPLPIMDPISICKNLAG